MSNLEKSMTKPSIEPYSGKYFAACGLGGIIGVSDLFFVPEHSDIYISIDHLVNSFINLYLISTELS